MPTREQVEQQLFEEQITTLSRQYMRNLRRTANVETKIR
jgi:peptidyl-prolyl cis-trans isomerase SurA